MYTIPDGVWLTAAGEITEVSAVDTRSVETRPVRFGGEEFALFLSMHDLAGGRIAADRLRLAVAALKFQTATGPLSITVSVGVASHRSAESLAELLARADHALYQAKETGRNRVCVAEG